MPTDNSAALIVLDVAEQVDEVEVLHEDAADVLVVDGVEELLLGQSLDPRVRQLRVGTLDIESKLELPTNHLEVLQCPQKAPTKDLCSIMFKALLQLKFY